MKLIAAAGLFAVATSAAFAQAPATSSPSASNPASPPRAQAPAQPTSGGAGNGTQTITGCLTSSDSVFTLTVMDDSGAPGTTVETVAYTLAPGSGVDLKSHVNKRVTVKGTEAGPDTEASTRVVQTTPAAPAATGTSGTAGRAAGGGTPTVETTAKARITAKTLNVSSVQPASGACGGK